MDVGTQQVYDNDLGSLEEDNESDLPQRNLFGFFDVATTTTTAPSTTAPSTIASASVSAASASTSGSTSTASTSTSGAHPEDRRPSRPRMPTAHFMHIEYAGWSGYQLKRLGHRHERTLTREDASREAKEAEPSLSAELEQMFEKLRAMLSGAGASADGSATDATDELAGEMERAAAVSLHGALLELLTASNSEPEHAHIWARDDEATAVLFSMRAHFEGDPGTLTIKPPMLEFAADALPLDELSCQMADVQDWRLESFVGVHDDAEEHARFELRLLQGEDDGLLFRFADAIAAATFERVLRVAAASARASASASASATATAATATATTATAAATITAATAAAPAVAAAAPKRTRTETARMRKGRELREALAKVASLLSAHKQKEAKEAFAAIPGGPVPTNATAKGRANELRATLFTFGGFNLTKAALDRFLGLKEVARLLDDNLLKKRQELADAKTATAMLHAAKRFLNEMLDASSGKTGGRRTDVERNAFWTSVVSLMPADLLENRQGRAMMRILGLQHRTIKRANAMRKELEDASKGWVLMETHSHRDNVEPHFAIMDDWFHGDHHEASSPDNSHKEQIRVYRGHGMDPQTGRRGFELHWRRAQEGKDKELLAKWHASEAGAKFKAATATARRPGGVLVGRKLLVKWRCLCVKLRAATFADCKICSFVEESLKLWHSKRFGWRAAKPPCTCKICTNAELAAKYREMSRSTDDLTRILLPCGRTPLPDYSLQGGSTFSCYNPLCCRNRCPKRHPLMPTPTACGWTNVFGSDDCPTEATDEPLVWYKWVKRSRTTQATTTEDAKTFTTEEWAPYEGTRKEFLRELRAALETATTPYFYHRWRHRWIRHSIKLHDERRDEDTATELADYAAVLDTPREKTGTCSVPERSNELVVAIGYKTREVTVEIPARGKRPASTKVVRKQHVDVFFAFHASGYKPDARSYNTATEDIDAFLKYGSVRHGEWFHEKQRLPGGDHSRDLPEGFSERPEQPPDFPEYEQKLSIKDGCAMQFDGKDNYHQVAEWHGKLGIKRTDWKLETMEGKNVCDPLGNMPKNTLQEAITRGDVLLVGTREKVLYLAMHRATPDTAKLFKEGWWAVGRIFYGFYEHKQFTALNVPRAVGFKDSHECHFFAGVNTDVDEARLNGPLTVRGNPCICTECKAKRFETCLMKHIIGPVRRVKVPREANATSQLRQLESLHVWAASLHAKQLVAMRADDPSIEGLYWLGVLLSKPETLTEDTLIATDFFEAGNLVVKIHYFKLESANAEGGMRKYLEKAEVRMIAVSSTIRLSGLRFSTAAGGPAGRTLRSGVTSFHFLGRDTHHSIEACCVEPEA